MASSFSSDLKLELMQTGENAGTWGDNTNNNLNLIQQAIAGFEQVTLSSGGTLALAMTDKTISNARNMVIKFASASIAASTVCTIPDSIEKFYIFDVTAITNPTNLTIKTASGTGFTCDQAKIYAAYSDGTNLNEISLDTLGGTVAAANISGTIATAQIADNAITSAKISDNQIVTAKVSDLQITTAKIADDSITPDKLSNTSVTAGSYELATITVDAQGRINAASAGSAGGGLVPLNIQNGPSSGTLSMPNQTTILAYAVSGGGGAAGTRGSGWGGGTAGRGGDGMFAVVSGTVSAPFSQPFAVGGGGGGGPPGRTTPTSGSSGGATSVDTVFNCNAGTGAPGNPQGSQGTVQAPGGTVSYSTNSSSADARVIVGGGFGAGGNASSGGMDNGPAGNPGQGGFMVIYGG